MGDGDGWVVCSRGHRHWGQHGAAGLLITDGRRAVLQHRAPWTHEGDTWAVPGGARDSHEDVVTAALREAREEAALDAASVRPIALYVDDHGGWSYTTVVALPLEFEHPYAANAESVDIRWWDNAEIDHLALHQGFAAAWPTLRTVPAPLVLVIDADSFPTELGPRLSALARAGIPASALPKGVDALGLSVLLPRVIVTGGLVTRTEPGSWWDRSITVADGLPAALTVGAQLVWVGADSSGEMTLSLLE
jgi:8-oxo-dGTP pyrophosphatase MutT (NUDIX family)